MYNKKKAISHTTDGTNSEVKKVVITRRVIIENISIIVIVIAITTGVSSFLRRDKRTVSFRYDSTDARYTTNGFTPSSQSSPSSRRRNRQAT